MFRFLFLIILILNFSVYALGVNDTDNKQSFEKFLQNIRTLALSQGISNSTLDKAFTGLTTNPKVIKYDRNQAEFSQNFWRYLSSRVNLYRLDRGKKNLIQDQKILNEIYKKYGVPKHIIVAFWGLETNYGNNVGKLNLIQSLATLAFDKRRSEFFTTQLLALLYLIDQDKIPMGAQGSWAGAMGHTQFMPTNVVSYGVDANQNGKLGLWDEKADIFASSANFLKNIGWHKGELWGREITIPKDFSYQLADLKIKKTVSEWQKLGVRNAFGKNLTESKMQASVILPMGYFGPAFLVYRNFHAILNWNRSILYALAVGHLSDRLIGADTLRAKPISEPSLGRNDIIQIQQILNNLGFDAGEADGISGPKTRLATRKFQIANNLPADGYVGYQLFKQLSNRPQK
jgi:membrane-bound lytic murein transglycosylase B